MICFKWYEVVEVFDFKKMFDGEISLFMILKQQILVFTKRAQTLCYDKGEFGV